MYDLFMSYHWLDRVAVEEVARSLRERGVKPFLDRWYLVPGRSWVGTLEKELANCRAVAIFIGPQGMGRWQQREREYALDRQTRDENFPVIPVLLPGADPALGFLSLNTWIDLQKGTTREAIENLAAAMRGETVDPDQNGRSGSGTPAMCPFRGLRPFREEDQPFFCGREAFTGILEAALEKSNLVAVVGASGSGKSSVVRAGLIPRLRRKSNCVWDVVVTLPQERPFHSLAATFLPLLEPELSEVDRLREIEKLAGALSSGEIQLRSIVYRALEKQPGTDRLLLFVDQWEELYTLCRDEAIRHSFISQLMEVLESDRMSLVFTLRGDFYGHALADRRLSDRLQDRVVNIGPMTHEELRSAIREPAEKVGLRFEDGLIDRILEDVGQEPGALPLLEFLLSELWEKRHNGELLHEAYNAIGGVRRAIAERAEQAFARLSAPEQEAAHWALLALVVPGEGAEDTRRRAQMQELDAVGRNVIGKLASDRLLVTTRDATGREVVEVGHEALIREWKRLREWVDENREFLRTLRRLEEEAEFWEISDRDPELLLPAGRRLIEAQHLLNERPQAVGGQARAYVTASVLADRQRQERTRLAEQQQLRRTRWFAMAVSVLLLMAIGFLLLSVVQYNIAQGSKEVAERSKEAAERSKEAAERSKDDAERRFGSALKFATTLVSKTDEHRKGGGVKTGTARELLGIADIALGDLAQLQSSPEHVQEVANRQLRLLLTVADSYTGLGDTSKALERATTSKQLARQLVAKQPANAEWNRLLYASCYRAGDALASQGQPDRAHVEYQTAREIVDRFAQQPSDQINWPLQQVFIYSKIGDLYKMQKKPDSARQQYDLALSIAESIVRMDPPHSMDPEKKEARHFLSATLNRIGDIFADRGDLQGALQRYQDAMLISRELAKIDRGPQRQITLAVRHSRLGTVLTRLGRLDEALVQFQTAQEIRARLVAMDSTETTYADYLASSYSDLGNVLKAQSKLNDAVEQYQKALTIREYLVGRDSSNRIWQTSLLGVQEAHASVLKADGKLTEAIQQYRKALASAENLARTEPENAAWQARLQAVRKDLEAAMAEQRNAAEQDRRSEPRLEPNERFFFNYTRGYRLEPA
ncbi:toll/interleukin-1 receptor domain-containing protein [Bradyrhizobium sp.]|uniref:toll/interleukin-1 receptor domain-containing protein n=1 Tax=Bradyrhizobium sp. TaxID=376 RepID=UPI002D0C10EC|nr:toll/interleukin-1 receptor domain-containing protein [Bradyrhizobium sp.]HMM88021.1 toll/interleukin-1 receptor domain-containing protein [Bradyrhizobium sp.]